MIVTAAEFASRHFDYLIVGGGVAGLVLAARLSEDTAVTVGVIEGGAYAPDMPEITVPGRAGSLVAHESLDWGILTAPQAGANGRVLPQPRGKVLGGSSATNILIMGRAPKHEYDAIEQLGNPGWNWDSFLHYFKKSETFTPPDPALAAKYNLMHDPANHGAAGPLRHSYPLDISPLHALVEAALKAHGVPHNPDPNGGNNVGSTLATACIDPATAARSSAVSAYYEPNAHRANLLVVTDALAERVLFAEEGAEPAAIGVAYTHAGRAFEARAAREVVLAAGALKTPQLLEQSGIGKTEILEPLGIVPRVDLPVGENLRESWWLDHCAAVAVFEAPESVFVGNLLHAPEHHAVHKELYKQQKGFYTSARASYSYLPLRAFLSAREIEEIKAELSADPHCTPALAAHFALLHAWLDDPATPRPRSSSAPLPAHPHRMLTRGRILEVPHTLGFAPPGTRTLAFAAALLHPLARGHAHAGAPPDPGYLAHPLDARVLAAGLRFVLRVMDVLPLPRLAPEEGVEDAHDGRLEAYVRQGVLPVFHPVGTAAMLPRAKGGVVDPKLRVYGTRGLRVVDASVLPFELACHSQATVYALAEKAADIIKESYRSEA